MTDVKHAPNRLDRAPVPFLDLISQHAELEAELTDVFLRALRVAGFIGGPMVEGFEQDFAAYCRAEHAVGVATGTDALLLALRTAGVAPGDVVVTVPHTFIATTEAITQAGALPEFVDIDERTYNLDPERLGEYLERQCTRNAAGQPVSRRSGHPVTAVVPVHLYGQMADMDAIEALAERFGLMVIEDAAQAHGAEYFSRRLNAWRRAGSVGRAAAFSFYPGKNLGACGEAGAVTTNDAPLAARVRMLRDHGQATKYYHDVEGYNARLDALQAGFLQVKLAHLDAWNAARRERAAAYHHLLDGAEGVVTPFEPEWSRAVYHVYVVRVARREPVLAELRANGIGAGIHYPIPLHRQKAYASLGYEEGAFPVAERVASECVSLPMFPTLTADQQRRTAACLRQAAARRG